MSGLTFPKTTSLTGRALARLLQGKKITHKDFWRETSSYRLSSSIERLRNRRGWQIEALKEKAWTSDKVRREVTHSRYFIDKDFLRVAKAELGAERVTNFIEAVQKFEDGQQ